MLSQDIFAFQLITGADMNPLEKKFLAFTCTAVGVGLGVGTFRGANVGRAGAHFGLSSLFISTM
jgi:hypothetical protein